MLMKRRIQYRHLYSYEYLPDCICKISRSTVLIG
jgi:hypothetical protein